MTSPFNVNRQLDDKKESYSNKKLTPSWFLSRIKLIPGWTYWKIRFVLGWPFWKIKFIFGWIYWNIIIAQAPSLPSNNQLRKKTLSRYVTGWIYWKIKFILGWLYWKPKFFFGWIYWNIIRDFKFKVTKKYLELAALITGRRKKFALMSISSYFKLKNTVYKVVFPPQKNLQHKINAIFLNEKPQKIPEITIDTPPVYLYKIKNALVFSRSDFTFIPSIALHQDHLDITKHISIDEMLESKIININQKRKTVVLNLARKPKRIIQNGILLTSPASVNWAHWLTEILPRLMIVNQYPEYKSYPLIINGNVPNSALESIEILDVYRRELIHTTADEAVQLKNGICISPTAEVPYHLRNDKAPVKYDEIMFCGPAIRMLRENAFKIINPTMHATTPMKKIYIKRTGEIRKIKNIEEIEIILQKKNYETVIPERLSFIEQVKKFQEASIIVGQTGAALMNMVFSPETCKVMALSTYTPYSNYYYFSIVANILSQNIQYVFGDLVLNYSMHPAFQDFILDIQKFESCLEKFEKGINV